MTNLNVLKSKDITLLTKICIVKAMVFPVVMYGCESWTITKADAEELMVLNYGAGKNSWESLGLQGDQISQSKGIQPWILIGRTGAEAEASKLWPPDLKTWLIGKDPNAEKDWGDEEKWATEDEMVGWHHQLNGHESEPTLRDTERQGSQACCSSLGHKVSDTTEPLNNNKMQSTSCWMNHKLESGC